MEGGFMTKQYDLGQLEMVELRTIWPKEARDFTIWLSKSENLEILGKAIGVDLELIETESSVGSFKADIVANVVETERKVIIENQLELSDHDHLGKTITYAAGKDAEAVVWIVKNARDEHRQAVEWLNQHISNEFGFFLVEIQLWKIDDSKPAPYFRVVEQPNEWAKIIKEPEKYSEKALIRLSYWTEYYEYAQKNSEFIMTPFTPQKPSKEKYSSLSCGSSKYNINLLIDTQKERIGIELYVHNEKKIGRKAIASKERFEEALELKAIPHDPEEKKVVRLQFFKDSCDIVGKKDKWQSFIEMQLQWAIAMKGVIDELGL